MRNMLRRHRGPTSGGRRAGHILRGALLARFAFIGVGAGMSAAAAGSAVAPAAAQEEAEHSVLQVPGLDAPVEIVVDRWGIPHIYASTEHDVFFAQGWNAARDRLFQLELWRRQATGTVAEILGSREVERDRGTRLFRFRGDLEQELRHYHPRGVEIVGAYVDGINAYIAETERDPGLLPVEFRLLDLKPGRWTPDVVISRHQGLLGNITSELRMGRAVARLGPEAVKRIATLGPGDPDLTLDAKVDREGLFEDILGVYNAFRVPVRFLPEDIVEEYRGDEEAFARLEAAAARAAAAPAYNVQEDVGSNNWVVSGRLSESGYPLMANDPHRVQAAPSLRYWVHLVGPGWNVIGGGEPSLPGVSIGHNEYGAWGLTVFRTDGEDLMVYETDPTDPERYRYRDGWERMTVRTEEIRVKGEAPRTVELKYTRHGPVVYEDAARHRAYAVRAAWMEVGGAPYLASLRMDQARSWEEFRDACAYSNIPGENMVWAGRDGTIGWQAVGIAPIRRNFSGLVPVPGDGRYEWDGYLPIKAKPHRVDPPEGFLATANNDLIPRDYPYMEAVGFEWTDPFRWLRIAEVLGSGRRHSLVDMMRLQTDYLSIPARQLVPLLARVKSESRRVEAARRRLLEWDYLLTPESVEAGIYVAWEKNLRGMVAERLVPEEGREWITPGMARVIQALTVPPPELANESGETDLLEVRDRILLDALERAEKDLTAKLGRRMENWHYGRARYKHVTLHHPLGRAVDEATRRRLEVGPLPRGGNAYTVNQTGNGDNQTTGASFRIIVDTRDWDHAVGMNNPGQAGDPDSPFYRDLFEEWARDGFHPVYFSRDRIERVAAVRFELKPGG
ncbi:MAG: penicillin acylase family protein [Gemmatimonadota bacterium]